MWKSPVRRPRDRKPTDRFNYDDDREKTPVIDSSSRRNKRPASSTRPSSKKITPISLSAPCTKKARKKSNDKKNYRKLQKPENQFEQVAVKYWKAIDEDCFRGPKDEHYQLLQEVGSELESWCHFDDVEKEIQAKKRRGQVPKDYTRAVMSKLVGRRGRHYLDVWEEEKFLKTLPLENVAHLEEELQGPIACWGKLALNYEDNFHGENLMGEDGLWEYDEDYSPPLEDEPRVPSAAVHPAAWFIGERPKLVGKCDSTTVHPGAYDVGPLPQENYADRFVEMDEIADEIIESYIKLQRLEGEGKKTMKNIKRRMVLAKQVQACHEELKETLEATDALYRHLYMVEDYQNPEIDDIIRQQNEVEALMKERGVSLAVGQVVKIVDETGKWSTGVVASEGGVVDVSKNRLKGKVRVSFPGYSSSWDRLLEDGDEIKIVTKPSPTASPMHMEAAGKAPAEVRPAVREAPARSSSGDRKSSNSLIIRLKRPRPQGSADNTPTNSNQDLPKRWTTPGKSELVRRTLPDSLPPPEPLAKIHIQLSPFKLKSIATPNEEKEHLTKKPQQIASENLTITEAPECKSKENDAGRELFRKTIRVVEKVRVTESVNTLAQRAFNISTL